LTTTTNCGKHWNEAELSARTIDTSKGVEVERDLNAYAPGGPALALDGAGRVYALSVRLEDGKGKRDLLLRSTADFGSWSESSVLAPGDDVDFRGYPAIAASGNRIHVAWIEGKDKKYEVWYRGSLDGGKTWCERLLLSAIEHPSGRPAGDYMGLAQDGKGRVHAAWGWRQDAKGEIWHNSVRWQLYKK